MTAWEAQLTIVRHVNTFWSVVSFVVVFGIGGHDTKLGHVRDHLSLT